MKTIVNVQTGEVTTVALTAEEVAESEAYERDVLPGKIRKSIESQRAAAYRSESDPLFFQYQTGEVTKEEWLAKREEIRARYPYLS
jgi:hypothetical protein